MECPLGQFGSARYVPSQDFPISGLLEVECWRDSSDALLALLTVARTLDEISIHPSNTSTSVYMLHLFLDVLMFHRATRLQTAPTSAPCLSLSETFKF